MKGFTVCTRGKYTLTLSAAVPASCTKTGLTAGTHCSVCGTVLVAQTEVAALGHTEAADAAVAPTCTETSLTAGTHCAVCNEVLVAQQTIPATGHSYSAVWSWSGYTSATATFTCANDDSHVATENAAITNEVTKESTCEETGVRTYTATVTFGGKTYTDTATEDIPVIPHSYENDICTQCGQPRHSEGLKYTDNADGTCYVSRIGSCTDTVLVIPRNYQGKAVTGIGSSAFNYCTGLTSVTIGNGVTSIGDYAFGRCKQITSSTMPGSVTSIGGRAFQECSGLTSITFTGTKDQWNSINKGAYWDLNTGAYTVYCNDGNIEKG